VIWRLLRLNLWVADALQLDPASGCDGAAALQETLFATFLAHMGATLFHTIVPYRKRLVSAWIFQAEKTADFCGTQMPLCRRGFCIDAF
jgi:hypothetical protein